MEISVGVFAHNEEKNIRYVLDYFLNFKNELITIKEIVVVSDGSTDRTNEIIKEYFDKYEKIKLILLEKRKGKFNAINKFLEVADSEIFITESADNIPHERAIEELLKPFFDENLGITCGRIVPVNNEKNFITFTGKLMYKIHHKISMSKPKFGEMIAFRNVIKKIPPTSVDEETIAMLIKKQGFKSKYCHNAVIFNKTPTNTKDFLKQRRRIFSGHLNLKREHNYNVATLSSFEIFKNILKEKKIFKKYFFWTIGAIILEAYGRFLGTIDLLKNKNHYVWDIAHSTKDTCEILLYKEKEKEQLIIR